MAIPERLAGLTGNWTATNRLWLVPGEPVHESETLLVVATAAQDRFLTFTYTWSFEGQPQEGMLLVGHDPDANVAKVVWVDAWHMQDDLLFCQGAVDHDGNLSASGHYPAPPGPDWGWQIDIRPISADAFQLLMYNITPEGESALAVRADYSRAS